MGALARLPVFLALEGKRVLVAGGTPAAAWKVELLLAAGANVDVYAAEPSPELLAVIEEAQRGGVTLHRREWRAGDCIGAAIAVGAFEDDAQAGRFAGSARAAGASVNVIDKPKFCDFNFGAIVNRSPLVIGISTDGAAPIFGQVIRAKLEAMIPRGFAQWVEAARRWRDSVKASGLSFNGRRRFWQLLTNDAVRRPDHRAGRRRSQPSAGIGKGGRRDCGARFCHAGRRGTGRRGAADASRRARFAISRHHPVRRLGLIGGARFRPPRGQEDAGRQDRARPVVQAVRHQCADRRAGALRQARWCG